MRKLLIIALLIALCPGLLLCQSETAPFDIENSVKHPGFFSLYWDQQQGKLWLEIDKWDSEFLYVNSLATGVGSNDIGLDRSQLGASRVVYFHRVGPKVLLIQANYSFRALSDNPHERRAVREAFAQSVLWGFTVAVEEQGRVVVDASDFFLRDVHQVAEQLQNTGQGSYALDLSRSTFYLPRTKSFPHNSEIEVLLTFTGNPEGEYVRQVVPTPEAITVRQHHSFIELPDDGYQPRLFDPRAGYFGIQFMDFAAAIDAPNTRRFISRHRLAKKDPAAESSEAVEPIIYYVDQGIPEPIRSAVIEGASWWNQAFVAAGYKNAFQVELLPEDADPMDVRYNVIQWVHRATRGWSYGTTIRDPRSGEILKGHIILGSLRVRQDFLIAQGLLAPFTDKNSSSQKMQEMALARIRQLSAHEVGHTLGLTHNYIASVVKRASVMDYPHPLVDIDNDGNIDLANAYAEGIGAWDKVAIRYGYQDFVPGIDQAKALDKILREAAGQGLYLISDADARPAGGAHPLAHLWDNDATPIAGLERVMRVRAKALEKFSAANIRSGEPMATLEEVLVPVYMYHRYQLEAVVKMLGGVNYTYALRDDGQLVSEIVRPRDQYIALSKLIQALSPEELALPENILALIPPRPPGYPRDRETFSVRTGVTFDSLSATEGLAHHIISLLLHPQRAARLVEHHARDEHNPSLHAVIDSLVRATWKDKTRLSPYHQEIQRTVAQVALIELISLAANPEASPQVRGIAFAKIYELNVWLKQRYNKIPNEDQRAHYLFAILQIAWFQKDPEKLHKSKPLIAPIGPPIGCRSEQNF